MVNNYLLSMKFTTLRIALLVALTSIIIPSFGQTAEIPTGNPTGGTTRKPLGVYFGYERSIMVYDKTEINSGAGLPSGSSISQLAFFYESNNCPPTAAYNCKIYLKEVNAGSLTSTTFANAITGAQLVFNGTIPPSNWALPFGSYVSIALQNCFIFQDNNKSIQVMVETNYAEPPTSDPNGWFSDGSCGASNSIMFRSSNTGVANFITWQADNSPPTASGTPTTIGRPNMRITYAAAPNCTALAPMTPSASATNVCSGVNFTVLLPTLPCVAGLTFQWQSAPVSSGVWGNIAGATNTSISVSQSFATSYRCVVTCTFSASSITSNPVTVNQNNYLSCYCAASATFTDDTDIGNVTMTRISNGSTILNNPPGGCTPVLSNGAAVNTYSSFTGLGPYNVIQGENYGLSMCQITSGTFFFSAFFNVFIDWNADGFFDPANERVLSGGPTSSGSPTASGSVPIPFSSDTGVTRMRVQLREGGSATDPACGTFGWGEVEDYNVNILPGVLCNLTTPGTATSSFPSVCTNQQLTLNITGNNTVGSFQTWQWQSAPSAGGPWANIAGATYVPYKTQQTSDTWYRCELVCNAGTAQLTAVVAVPMAPPTQCYCIPPHPAGCSGNWIDGVVFNTLSNTLSGCTSGNANSYTQYPVSGSTTTSVTQGSTYNLSVTTLNGIAIISVWIDYNRNGVFEASEWSQVATNNGVGATATIPISIPLTTGTGLTGMRIRSRSSGSPNGAGDACTAFFSGEAEDYFITILPFIPPVCLGTPAAGYSVTSTQAAPCSGSNFTLTLNIPLFSGMVYQWQSAPSALGPWTNIAGANSITHTRTQTQTTYYQCLYSCTPSAFVQSATLLQNSIPNFWKGVNSDWSDVVNWCSGIPRITDNVLISRTQPGVASPYFTPVISGSDSVFAANLTISLNDTITLFNDTLNAVNIDSTLLLNGKLISKTSASDSCCSDISNGTLTLNTYQPFKFAKENRFQMVYIPQDFISLPTLSNSDQVTYILFKFEAVTAAVTNPYQNFSVSFGWLPTSTIAFSTPDPFPTPYSAYTNSSYNLSGKALNDTIMIPVSNFKWRTDSNLVLQFCYNTNVGAPTPGGIPPYQAKVRSGLIRKTTLYLTSTNDANDGCALLSSTPGVISDFVDSRPNIRLIFGRKPKKLNIPIRNLIVNSTGVFSSTISNITVATDVLNSGAVNLDSAAMAVTGNLTNSGTFNMNYVYGAANEISSLAVTGTVTNSGTLTAGKSSMTLNGATITNTGTINAGTATHTFGSTAGTFDNAAGGTFNAESSTLNVNSANFNNSGTYVQGTGLVALNSAVTQTIGGTSPLTIYRLRLNKTANTNFVTLVNNAVSVTDSIQLLKGSINLNGNTLKFLNPSVLTMRPSTTAGYVVSSLVAPTNFDSKLQWTIGTTTGIHIFPFLRYPLVTAEANNFIPVEFANVAGAADPVGDVIVATYPTSTTNTPLPPNVWHINNGTGVNNSANMGNRYWYLERTTPIVTPGTGNTTLAFSIANNEKKATQTITGLGPVSNIRMQPYYTYSVASPPPLVRAAWLPGPGTQGTTTTALGAPFRTLVNTFTWPATVGSSGSWASGINTTPLPIELLQFDATLNGTSSAPYVDIDWATASEENNDFFTIEKTIDFSTISEVDRTPSLGNSTSIQKYHTVDNSPVKGKVNYYRLKQTDFNGTSTINDKWVAVKVGMNEVFTINYVKNQDKLDVIFEYDQDNSINVIVTDLAGREMFRSAGFGATSGLNVLPIDAAGWADGAYIITLSDNERQVSHKIFY